MVKATVILLLALVLVPAASAGDWHNGLFDQAAASVSGHTTPVYCEDSWLEWYNVFGRDQNIAGFTIPSHGPTVWVSPQQCGFLWSLANHEDVGTFWAASALLTLVHEAIHQRGGEFANCTSTDPSCESRTECAAIPLVPGVASQFFGIPQQVNETNLVPVVKKRKVGKRIIRYTTYVAKTTSRPNPYLTRLATDVMRWHNAKPAAYRMFC